MAAGLLAAHHARGQRRRLAAAVMVVAPDDELAPARTWLVWNANTGSRARRGRLRDARERRSGEIAGNLADRIGPLAGERERGVGDL